jgi:signal transduction histidine kinase/ActR/RegA family two-component response regulator
MTDNSRLSDFAFLIEKNADGVIVIDDDGLVLFANPSAEEIFGRSAKDLVGAPIGVPIDRSGSAEIVILRPDGGQLDAEMRVVETSWNGRPALLASIRDVSARRALEEHTRQAQKMQALGQLTGGIAHDFNNLLMAVVGSLDMIQRRADDPRLKRLASNALQAAERGTRLTSQLLAFSRLQKLDLQPIDVSGLVGAMEGMLRNALGPTIGCRLALEPNLAPVLGDATQIEMALLNLAINARDAMPGKGELTVSTQARQITGDTDLENGEFIELRVRDTGIGMDANVAARAFEPFFTTKAAGQGTGLGLSMVYGVAKQSGGVARIESSPGQGTTVCLLFRAANGHAVTQGAEFASAPQAPNLAGVVVLVIDDDVEARGTVVEMLEYLGALTIQAGDGPSGLEAFDREGPDLLIIDYAMPGMNGADVATEVRGRDPKVPLVFASGYADSDALEFAANDAMILRKPFREAELGAVLKRALSARSASSPGNPGD